MADPQATKENTEILKAKTDAKIFPVWQMTDSLEELQKIVNNEPEMIEIGGAVPFLSNRIEYVRKVLKQVFSYDSTAYINARKSEKQRQVYLEDGTRVPAPRDMTTLEIIRQNLCYLIGLENTKNQLEWNW